MEDEGGGVEADALRDKWRVDRPRVEKIGVIADFPELHQDVDDTHEVPCGQRLLGAERVTAAYNQLYPRRPRNKIINFKSHKHCCGMELGKQKLQKPPWSIVLQ